MSYLIGTDIGTLGAKTVMVDLDGRVITSSFEEYEVITQKPGWAEQWPHVWVEAASKTIKDALDSSGKDSKDVAALCVSGLYGGSGILCDREVTPLRPCLIWADRRAVEESRWVKETIGEGEVFKVTGNVVDPYYGYTKMLYIKNREPNTWAKTRFILTPNAYFIHKLTGALSIDLSSAGNYGGIFDIHKREWAEPLMQELGIPRDFFPEEIVMAKDVVGEVTGEGAGLTGLAKGTPVSAGGIDAPVSALSVGAIEDGDLASMLGTSMCNGFISEELRLSPKLVNYPHVVRDREMLYSFAGIVTAGYCVRWFRDQLARREAHLAEQLNLNGYSILDLEAERVPAGSEGLLFLPHMMVGERAPYWDDHVRGVLAGLTVYHTKAHLFRAFLEGVAYAVKYSIEVALDSGMSLRRALLVDGGARSSLWRRILASVTGRSMGYIGGAVGAPLGDALLAGVGCGVLRDYGVIREWVRVTEMTDPDPGVEGVYAKQYRLFKRLYEDTRRVFEEY